MAQSASLSPHLPYLRRYARALTGSQAAGDAYVRAALTAVLTGILEFSLELPPRVALYRLFHTIWSSIDHYENYEPPFDEKAIDPEQGLQSLALAGRAALLLTAVEGFSISEVSRILREPQGEVKQSIIEAQRAIEEQLASRVLIIEDESVVALDLENLVRDLGHHVLSTAATKDEAVAKARREKPGLILASINLDGGGSSIDAVTEILRTFDVPVIFVTAHPERLLTGERPEPTYLVTKPFVPETVQATIGQALFFNKVRCQVG